MNHIKLRRELIKSTRLIFLSEEFKYSCLSIFLFTFIIFLISPPWRILNFDEVDYFNAASKGFWVNALDSSSLDFKSYLSLVIFKLNWISNLSIPIQYSEELDTMVLRHWHPPFLQYLTAYFNFIPLENYEMAEKFVFLARWSLGSVFIFSAYYVSGYLFQRKNKKSIQLLKLLFISYTAILLSLYLQYHILAAIALLFTTYSLTRVLNNPIRKNFLLLSVTLSFSIISLETTLFSIIAISIFYLLIEVKNNKLLSNKFRIILIYFWLLPFFFSFLLWPGSLTKLSILKQYSYYFYKLFFVKKEWVGVFEYQNLVPILILLLIFLILLSISVFVRFNLISFSVKTKSYQLCIFLGGFYSICMLPFSLFHTYMVPGLFLATLPIVEILNEDIFERTVSKILQFILIGAIFIGFNQINQLKTNEGIFGGYPSKDSIPNILKIVEKEKNIQIYSDAGNILKFYLPTLSERITHITVFNKKKDSSKEGLNYDLLVREKQEYKELKIDSINNPSLFLFRKYNKDIINNISKDCLFLKIEGLDGSACLINR